MATRSLLLASAFTLAFLAFGRPAFAADRISTQPGPTSGTVEITCPSTLDPGAGKTFRFSHWTLFEGDPTAGVAIAPTSSTRRNGTYVNGWDLGGVDTSALTLRCSYLGTTETIVSMMPKRLSHCEAGGTRTEQGAFHPQPNLRCKLK